MSAEQCQGPRRNDRLKHQKDFLGIGNFYRYRLQILANLSWSAANGGLRDGGLSKSEEI